MADTTTNRGYHYSLQKDNPLEARRFLDEIDADISGGGSVHPDTRYASLSAAVTAIGSSVRTLLITTANFPDGATCVVPATLRLVFDGAGSLSVTTGHSVTINSSFGHWPLRKIFNNCLASQGQMFLYGPSPLLSPRWFGALFDDSTDDAPSILAAINSLGSTSATRGGPHCLIDGPCCIGSTVTIDRKSIILRGLGWGRQGSTGVQSYLRWIGSAGSPMLRIQNVQGFQVRDLHFIGKSSAKPSCAISCYQVAGFGINNNFIENVAIGDLNDGTAIGVGFTSGILFEGATANNSAWRLVGVTVTGCSAYGIRQNSIQNVRHQYDAISIGNCPVGIYVCGEVSGTSWEFGTCDVCIQYPILDDQSLPTIPQVSVKSLLGESNGRLLEILGAGLFTVDNGYFQIGSFTNADGKYIKAEGLASTFIRISNYGFPQVSSPSTAPFISLKKASYSGSTRDTLILDGITTIPVGGPSSNGIDATTTGTQDTKDIYFRTLSGTTADYGVVPVTHNMISGIFGGGGAFDPNREDFNARLRTFQSAASQSIASAGTAITVDRFLCLIKNTSGGSLTLTGTPTIANGAGGEIIRVMNVGTNPFVLQDQGTLASSNLRLKTSTVTLATRDSILLQFTENSSAGDYSGLGNWVEVSRSTAGLTVSDDAYDATTWNGNLEVPTKNAIRDKIETLLTAPSLTAGSVIFSGGGSALSQDNANLFWDDTNNFLGIGTNAPGYRLNVADATANGRCGQFIQSAVTGTNYGAVLAALGSGATENIGVYGFASGATTNKCFQADGISAGANNYAFYSAITAKVYINGQVGLGISTPATSALLDLTSTTGALLLSRMTTTQRNALTAVNGMIIYNSTTTTVQVYQNGAWTDVGGGGSTDVLAVQVFS